MGRFIAGTVIRPVTTTMVTIAIVLFGLVAFTRLPVELLPDLSYPSITVRTTYTDAAPTEVEELITRPIEELVGAVPGVIRVESVSREGEAETILDFAWGTAMDTAMADVREKLDRVNLPTTADRPIVLRYDPAQEPIMRLALVAGELAETSDLASLRHHADRQVKRSLEKLEGVAAVALHGGEDDEVLVELDPRRLAAFRMSSADVVAAIQSDNVNRPGGALTEQGSRYLIRTVHEAKTPAALGETILRSEAGSELRLRDVARIRRAPAELQELSLVGGRPAVELSVHREGDANTVAVANRVLADKDKLQLAPGYSVVVLSNQAKFIEAAVREVRDNTLVGGALAVLVLLFFLRNLRATLIIAVAIPISLLATFVPLRALDVSLNLMSLGGLALGVGMLVDNSIVVLESIARVRDQNREAEATGEIHGAATRADAITGTSEVAGSVVASTLTTVAVFFPMAFVEGVAGQLVRDLSYAVSFSIVSSMVVSLTLVPVLSGLGDAGEAHKPDGTTVASWLVVPFALLWRPIKFVVRAMGVVLGTLSRPAMALWEALERRYPAVLGAALRHPGLVIMGAIALCAATVGMSSGLGRNLLPEIRQGEFFAQVSMPQGTALSRTTAVAERLAAAVEGDERIELTFARVGSVTQADNASGSVNGTHLAQVNVRLRDGLRDDDGAIEAELFSAMAAAVREPDARVELGRPALFSFDPPLEIRVFSEDPLHAADFARRALPKLADIPGLVDLVPDDLLGRPEVRVHFDRERLGRLGIGIDAAAQSVQRSIQGEVATQLHAADRQLDVRVQLPRVDRSRVEDVREIQVGVVEQVPVKLSAVADVEAAMGPAEIRRIDGRRGLRIRARLDETDLGTASAATTALLEDLRGGDASLFAEVAGQAEEMERSLQSLTFTALLSVFLVYVVMASSFESLLHPFLIMFTVPLAVAGVLLACIALQIPISAMVGIGTIILGGIVVNNAIVLVNAVNARRGGGADVRGALLAAGQMRLRPILMTTLTTVLGLLPMAIGMGEGAALRRPLAVAVIGGLSLSTLLTLVVIPAAYRLLPGRTRDAWRSEIP